MPGQPCNVQAAAAQPGMPPGTGARRREGRVQPFPPPVLQAEQHGAKFRSSGKAQHAVVRRHDVHVALPLLPTTDGAADSKHGHLAPQHHCSVSAPPDQIPVPGAGAAR